MKRFIFILWVILICQVSRAQDFSYFWPWIKANISNGTLIANVAVTNITLLPLSSTGYVSKVNAHTWGISFPTNQNLNALTNMILATGTTNTLAITNGVVYLQIKTNYTGSATNTVSGSSLSALWYSRGYNDVVAGGGDDMIARDTGLWHLNEEGDIVPNDSETYPDFNWIQNGDGDLTSR
jgi:hypothetical protein